MFAVDTKKFASFATSGGSRPLRGRGGGGGERVCFFCPAFFSWAPPLDLPMATTSITVFGNFVTSEEYKFTCTKVRSFF